MDYVSWAVWGMLYADDACTASRSVRRLEEMMEIVIEFVELPP